MSTEHYRMLVEGGFLLFLDMGSRRSAEKLRQDLLTALRRLGRVVELSPGCYHWRPPPSESIEKLREAIPALRSNDLVVCVPLERKEIIHFFVAPSDSKSCGLRVEEGG